MAISVGTLARNAQADAVAARFDAGAGAATIQIRTGSKPANPQAAATGTLLATLTLADPAWAAASAGVAALDATPVITANAVAAGTAGWWRALDSNNVAIVDGTAGSSGTDMIIDNPALVVGQTVNLTVGTMTAPETP